MMQRREKHWKHCVTLHLGLGLLRSSLGQGASLGTEVVLATSVRAGEKAALLRVLLGYSAVIPDVQFVNCEEVERRFFSQPAE